ncbi:hypothetical protein ADL22_03300 [Streptomyces sp. NRRL F-4489]|uniref:LmeA family phospholipid-binding protein n=1 Tax=Streptomyces sp. NRRL F-4489 TaxID=1609095 RepID=UPI0007489574|nr:DUF2993 domain-containing protein [Streptomyces sp. NRRL F-4489]KUL54319.1 hypothetical protein ADL22_03300 [Streptomyces sp. NRRL F-4489]
MRALKVLLVLVVIFGGLFVAADRLAVNFAEDKAAEKLRSLGGVTSSPTVSIKGFPFLTQVAGRNLDEVDADLDHVAARSEGRTLTLKHLSAQFHDVALTSDYTSIESAASATATAEISYADMTNAAGGGVKISYGGEKDGRPQVKISPNIPLLSSFDVTGSISVHGNTVQVRADSLPEMCRVLPGCERKVRAQTDHGWKLDQLPGNLKLEKVTTTAQGITVTASGSNVKITG